jgi:hypothetical protein
MWSDKKQKIQGSLAAALLVCVPLLLNACSGNPLNGEKLSLWKSKDQPSKPPASTPQGQQPGGPHPATTPTPPANPCNPGVPDLSGQYEANDSDLASFNAEVAALEQTQPQPSDLEDKIRDFADAKSLGLKPSELKVLQKKILKLSTAQPTAPGQPAAPGATNPPSGTAPAPHAPGAPAPVSAPPTTPPSTAALPAPGPAPIAMPANISTHGLPDPHQVDAALQPAQESAAPSAGPATTSPTAQASGTPPSTPAPYFLHPSIVAFVAYQRAVTFAMDATKLGIDSPSAAQLAGVLAVSDLSGNGVGPNDVPVILYIKTYNLAASSDGLGYSSTVARLFTETLLGIKPHGYQMGVTWVTTYAGDVVHSHFTPAAAIADANTAIGYTPGSDPTKGFCGVVQAPVAAPQATPPTAPKPQPPAVRRR